MTREPILIVDDSPANLKLARVVLQAEGYEVRVTTDAEQALKLLEDWRPRLILMDIQLPGMDGLTLTRRLKDDPATRDIVIVALTAYAMTGDEERARAAGCDGYVSKPIDIEALPRVVAEHLARASRPAADPVAAAAILVVEDNPVTRKLFRLTLEAEGYRVAEAPDATTALALVQAGLPALALVDLVLPDILGAELAQRLRALPGGAELPLIAVSGYPGVAAEVRMSLGGFDVVLAKPIDVQQLVEIVRAYVPLGAADGAEPGRGKRVLVVDDDPMQLKLTTAHLRHAGLAVSAAPSGEAALEIARASPPDLIVSDVLMPGVDGFELCLAVRHDPRLTAVPVVLVSAHYREAADDELARRVGACAFVVRSPDSQGLVHAVVDHLGAAAPPLLPEPLEEIEEAHRRRIVKQFERQASVNLSLVRRGALQAAQLSILGGIADALAGSADVELAIQHTLASCLDAGGMSKGALYQKDAGERLVLRHALGFSEADRTALESAFGFAHLLDQVMSTGTALSVRVTQPRGGAPDALLQRLGVGAAVIVPLPAHTGQRVGALLLGTNVPDVAEPDLLGFGRAITAYLGQAIALAAAFEREQQARCEAERANRAKDEFLSTLSHELRTPLTAILGWATLLGTRGSDPAWLARAITTIQRNARAQVQLIDDLFDVGRINGGKLRLEVREMSLVPSIQAVLDAVVPMAEAKEIRVEGDLDPGAGAIRGDPERVQQIVWNLVSNGVKFTPRGGAVSVRLARRGARVELQVRDTGEGIRADFLPHVFERFHQADSSATREHGGLGLGLWIVHHLVELHAGDIRIESEGEGRGTTATVTFPLHPAAAEADAREPPCGGGHAAELAGVSVLVVEDDADAREMFTVVLREAGGATTAVDSGAAALAELDCALPDVLVSDISMPVMDGYGLLRAVRTSADRLRRQLPAIALTAHAGVDDRRAALDAGFQVHLSKPVDPCALVSAVAGLAGRGAMGA